MKMPPFVLYSPSSITEAMSIAETLMDVGEDFDWISGGTDLLPNYKWHLNPKSSVISLAGVQEMSMLTSTHIGGMVRIHDLCNSPSTHPMIKQAAETIASVMIRRSGTVGGNICLDTRCFWFNQTEDWRRSIEWCHKCDCDTSADCRVIPNQNTLCVATYQADLAPVLMCLSATIHLVSPQGERSMPLSEFFELDGMKRNVLEEGELVSHLTLPKEAENWNGSYRKLRLRKSWDFPEAGVAVAWTKGGDNLEGLRVATTGCESIPRLHEEEASLALENWNGAESIKELGRAIRKAVKPVNNTYFPPAYRRKMLPVLVKRAFAGLNSETKVM
ncbi:MAG: hypothetical protein CMB49_05515 [Euryarchaeota archaeon]|nr:hypothetical protein [Euryarchaeota archaeon]